MIKNTHTHTHTSSNIFKKSALCTHFDIELARGRDQQIQFVRC